MVLGLIRQKRFRFLHLYKDEVYSIIKGSIKEVFRNRELLFDLRWVFSIMDVKYLLNRLLPYLSMVYDSILVLRHYSP